MSVLIRGMEMPDSCHVCVAGYGGCCYAAPPESDGICPDHGRADWCPLIEIKPHGDLIDRDALRASIKESIDECHKWADEVDKDTMMYARISQSVGTFVECSLRAKAAPAVIPASDEDINVLIKEEGE